MKSNYFETILGSIILLFALYGLMIFFQANKSFDNDESIKITARFLKSGGVFVGNDVKLRGIKIGTVSNISLDENYLAQVDMLVDKKIQIPKSSEASIQSEGILGNKYISIVPSDDKETFLSNEEEFINIKDFDSIEDQVSKIIFLATQ